MILSSFFFNRHIPQNLSDSKVLLHIYHLGSFSHIYTLIILFFNLIRKEHQIYVFFTISDNLWFISVAIPASLWWQAYYGHANS